MLLITFNILQLAKISVLIRMSDEFMKKADGKQLDKGLIFLRVIISCIIKSSKSI